MYGNLIPLKAISPAKKEVTNQMMMESHKQCDDMLLENHHKKLETLKKLAYNMDKERKYAYKKRAKSAAKNNIKTKTIEMKNSIKAEERNEVTAYKQQLTNTESRDLNDML